MHLYAFKHVPRLTTIPIFMLLACVIKSGLTLSLILTIIKYTLKIN